MNGLKCGDRTGLRVILEWVYAWQKNGFELHIRKSDYQRLASQL